MRRLITFSVVVLSAAYLVLPNFAQTGDTDLRSPVNVRALMQQKLESAQSIMKGLALEDFELLEKEAQKLQLLSLDTGWNVIQTKEYARISREFRDAAKKIHQAGKDKNLDAAGIGHFQLTMTCIDCHRHLRKVNATKR